MEERNNKEDSQNKPKKNLHAIRTFKTDTSEYVQKGDVSVTDLFVKEQKPISYDIEKEVPKIEENSKKPLIIAIIAVSIIALGLSAYFLLGKKNGEVTVKETALVAPEPLLISEGEVVLSPKNREDFRKQLNNALNEENNPGNLIYLPTKKQVDSAVHFLNGKEFLNALEISAPPFLTNFLEDNFFFGFINLQKKHTLLIFKVEKNQYDNAFAGMIRWEKSIVNDLDFIAEEENVDASKETVFKDKIIKNQSARLAKTDNGDILVYTFINRNYIIITDSQESLEEIIKRFVLYKFSML